MSLITVYGANTELHDLHKIALEAPEGAGSYWQGIQHGDLADTIIDEAHSRGWEINDMKFSVDKSGTELAAGFGVVIPKVDVPKGMSLGLGILTSNARKRSLKMVVGATIACCHNGMATGEIVLNKRHTTGFDIFDEIDSALTVYAERVLEMPATVASLRECKLASYQAEAILMDAGRSNVMSWSRICKVDSEYRTPTFSEHGTGTSWALLNAFTHIAKELPVLQQMDRMNQFRELLPVAAL